MSAPITLAYVVAPVVFALLMSACAPVPSGVSRNSSAVASGPTPVDVGHPDGCHADAARWTVGKAAAGGVVDRARSDAGAQVVRVLVPGQMITKEYQASRLSIDVDANNVITNVRCG